MNECHLRSPPPCNYLPPAIFLYILFISFFYHRQSLKILLLYNLRISRFFFFFCLSSGWNLPASNDGSLKMLPSDLKFHQILNYSVFSNRISSLALILNYWGMYEIHCENFKILLIINWIYRAYLISRNF